MRSEWGRITHEVGEMKQSIKNNTDKGSVGNFWIFQITWLPPTQKVKANKIRPYLVANIVELLDIDVEEKEEESAFKDVSLEVSLKISKSRYNF